MMCRVLNIPDLVIKILMNWSGNVCMTFLDLFYGCFYWTVKFLKLEHKKGKEKERKKRSCRIKVLLGICN